MLSTAQFEHDLADLTPDQFEQLVHAIVLKDHPDAQRLKAPDFGADVLDDPTSRQPRVWQVKHYPNKITWSNCQESVERAFAKWRPAEISFVFPRDLTGKEQQEFNDKLVGHRDVPVTRWTAGHLNEALERHPAIRRSFFPHRTDAHHELLRAARLTETPTDGPAFFEHGLVLAQLIAELDPNFDYEQQIRAERLPKALWDPAPFMTATMRGEGNESVVAAFAKPDAPDAAATYAFTDDEAGADARRLVYLGLARGEPVRLSAGVTVAANPAPRVIEAMIDHIGPDAEFQSALTINPIEETLALRVSIEGASPLGFPLTFQMRAAPPEDGHDGAWVGLASGVLLYLGVTQKAAQEPVTLHFSPTMDLGPSAGENAVATATIRDLYTHPLVIDGEFPRSALDLRPLVDTELLQRLDDLDRLYGALIEIEARTGQHLRLPDRFTSEDANAALNIMALLRDRRTSGHSTLKTTIHVPANQAAGLASRLAETRQVAVPFEQDLLGYTIRHGWARLTFEHVTVGTGPSDRQGAVDLRLEAEGEITVQLIDGPLPSDVALDLATGQWRSTLLE